MSYNLVNNGSYAYVEVKSDDEYTYATTLVAPKFAKAGLAPNASDDAFGGWEKVAAINASFFFSEGSYTYANGIEKAYGTWNEIDDSEYDSVMAVGGDGSSLTFNNQGSMKTYGGRWCATGGISIFGGASISSDVDSPTGHSFICQKSDGTIVMGVMKSGVAGATGRSYLSGFCSAGVEFDGGGSTQFWEMGSGSIVSTSRYVKNIVVIYRKKGSGPTPPTPPPFPDKPTYQAPMITGSTEGYKNDGVKCEFYRMDTDHNLQKMNNFGVISQTQGTLEAIWTIHRLDEISAEKDKSKWTMIYSNAGGVATNPDFAKSGFHYYMHPPGYTLYFHQPYNKPDEGEYWGWGASNGKTGYDGIDKTYYGALVKKWGTDIIQNNNFEGWPRPLYKQFKKQWKGTYYYGWKSGLRTWAYQTPEKYGYVDTYWWCVQLRNTPTDFNEKVIKRIETKIHCQNSDGSGWVRPKVTAGYCSDAFGTGYVECATIQEYGASSDIDWYGNFEFPVDAYFCVKVYNPGLYMTVCDMDPTGYVWVTIDGVKWDTSYTRESDWIDTENVPETDWAKFKWVNGYADERRWAARNANWSLSDGWYWREADWTGWGS